MEGSKKDNFETVRTGCAGEGYSGRASCWLSAERGTLSLVAQSFRCCHQPASPSSHEWARTRGNLVIVLSTDVESRLGARHSQWNVTRVRRRECIFPLVTPSELGGVSRRGSLWDQRSGHCRRALRLPEGRARRRGGREQPETRADGCAYADRVDHNLNLVTTPWRRT
ncbi:hypothetical protein EXIGLDRAFT_85071 [Exidia glandulosa HHB12029]|uniref:Uncharacterized protein n=1 Tax=Exidia glandulosa HHB12029 TaxID=1314781 RepID=A0A165HGY5_EXIGL|nr:hypothetical protein EXIGLDRAFT_85071 [Exidia glandulosa HHB12029]